MMWNFGHWVNYGRHSSNDLCYKRRWPFLRSALDFRSDSLSYAEILPFSTTKTDLITNLHKAISLILIWLPTAFCSVVKYWFIYSACQSLLFDNHSRIFVNQLSEPLSSKPKARQKKNNLVKNKSFRLLNRVIMTNTFARWVNLDIIKLESVRSFTLKKGESECLLFVTGKQSVHQMNEISVQPWTVTLPGLYKMARISQPLGAQRIL